MRHTLLIAGREYTAYIKTVGFWLSVLLVPILIVASMSVAPLLIATKPADKIAVLDLTREGHDAALKSQLGAKGSAGEREAMVQMARIEGGADAAKRVADAYDKGGAEAARGQLAFDAPSSSRVKLSPRQSLSWVEAPAILKDVQTAAEAQARLQKAVTDETKLPDKIILFHRGTGRLESLVWQSGGKGLSGMNNLSLTQAINPILFRDAASRAGFDPDAIRKLQAEAPKADVFTASEKSGKAASLSERLRPIVGFASGFLLWISIFSTATLMMNSIVEEKANRVLEVLMATTSAESILIGKLLGVAMVIGTVMLLWGAVGAYGLHSLATLQPEWLKTVMGLITLTDLALILVFLALGYVLYSVMFLTLGAFCETPREAQSLLGPVIVLLMIPIMVLNAGLYAPELPLITYLSWVPFFAPFLVGSRLTGAEPSPMELALMIGGMLLSIALVLRIARKAFGAAALSSGEANWKGLMRALSKDH